MKLKKREQKYKENANEGFEMDPNRRKFASGEKIGKTTTRVLNLLRRRQGIGPRKGQSSGPRRTFTPSYTGPSQKVEKGNP